MNAKNIQMSSISRKRAYLWSQRACYPTVNKCNTPLLSKCGGGEMAMRKKIENERASKSKRTVTRVQLSKKSSNLNSADQ
jgi:hypothetical protein